jgi:hypothetical protein
LPPPENLKYVSFLLTPFSIISRRDENFRRLLRRARKTAWLNALEQLGLVFAGYYFCRLGAWWAIPSFLLIYFLAGWYDPVLWKRMYGVEVSRRISFVENLNAVWLFLLGWMIRWAKMF